MGNELYPTAIVDRYDPLSSLSKFPPTTVCLAATTFVSPGRNVVMLLTFENGITVVFPYHPVYTFIRNGITTVGEILRMMSGHNIVHSTTLEAYTCPCCHANLAVIKAVDSEGGTVLEPYCVNHNCNTYFTSQVIALTQPITSPVATNNPYPFQIASQSGLNLLTAMQCIWNLRDVKEWLYHTTPENVARLMLVPAALDQFYGDIDCMFGTGMRIMSRAMSAAGPQYESSDYITEGLNVLRTSLMVNSWTLSLV